VVPRLDCKLVVDRQWHHSRVACRSGWRDRNRFEKGGERIRENLESSDRNGDWTMIERPWIEANSRENQFQADMRQENSHSCDSLARYMRKKQA
jgi:hypothetical protein